jgi:hypothetical protein
LGILFINIDSSESESNIARGFNHGKQIGETYCVPVVETTGYVRIASRGDFSVLLNNILLSFKGLKEKMLRF